MRKILIIGAGVEQTEAIKLAKEMGLYVIVSDINPKAPGIKYADKYYEISTTDAKNNIVMASEEKIDGVMTVCSETAVMTVAKIAKKMNLPGFSEEVALKATNKEEMRKVLSENKVNVSPFVITDNFESIIDFINNYGYPVVLKPVDNSGQRGTSVIYDIDNLEQAFNIAKENSYRKRVLIDKFIKGREVHVTMQVINKKIHYLAFSDRITLGGENFGIAVRHIGPAELDIKQKNIIIDICEKSISSINLENGVATAEIIIENDTAYLMEIAIRVPGGYLREVALYLSGIDIIKTTILNSLGEIHSLEDLISGEKYKAVSVKFISALNIPPSIQKISEPDNLKKLYNENVKLINMHFDNEFIIPPLSSSVGRFGVIITVGKTREEALDETERVFNKLSFKNIKLKKYTNYNKYNILYN